MERFSWSRCQTTSFDPAAAQHRHWNANLYERTGLFSHEPLMFAAGLDTRRQSPACILAADNKCRCCLQITPAIQSQLQTLRRVRLEMALFTWDERFLTGEASVDHEHRGLVDLINRVAALQTEDNNGASAAQILDELVEYAAVHFQHEEALMASTGCDPRHTQAHAGVHQHFARQVSQMRQTGAGEADLEYLLRFLSSWLAYHILGMDQAMTRQIRHIRTGMSAAEAYEAEKKVATDPATSSLNRPGFDGGSNS
jgi:hemerythrin-like metal-binding protein